MARVVIVTKDQGERAWELRPGLNVVGRREECDVVLEDGSVSGRHCSFAVSDFGVTLTDLGSTNGTYVAGEKVASMELTDGQTVRLGTVDLRVEIPAVNIAIPEIAKPELPGPRYLPDGTPACQNHPDVPADYRCVGCQDTFCAACIHDVHLKGQQSRLFCPACSGACEPLPGREAKQPVSFAARVLSTVKLPFRRRRGSR